MKNANRKPAKPKIGIVAFLKDKKIAEHEADSIGLLKTKFDGYRIDELGIVVILKTKQDFDDLRALLNVHENCFNQKDWNQKKEINEPKY